MIHPVPVHFRSSPEPPQHPAPQGIVAVFLQPAHVLVEEIFGGHPEPVIGAVIAAHDFTIVVLAEMAGPQFFAENPVVAAGARQPLVRRRSASGAVFTPGSAVRSSTTRHRS